MSNNIWGYQGLQTPLESLTNGNYNVADYTTMRKEFNARLQALENAGGFQPTNVQIQGYCSIVPGTQGAGNLSASGATSLGSTLTVSGNVTCSAGLSVAGVLTAGSLNFTSISVSDAVVSNLVVSNSADFNGAMTTKNITIDGGSIISGNGSGLTNINDITKLPLAGGTVSGALGVGGNLNTNGSFTSLGNIIATAPAKFVGDGSLITGVIATDATKLPLAGGTMTGAINMNANAITSSGSITAATFFGNGAGLTNVIASPPAPTFIVYTTSPGIVSLNFSSMDNYIFFRTAGPFGTYVFTGRVVGQKITFVRESINGAYGVALAYLTNQPGSLPFRVYFLNGTTVNVAVNNDTAGASYTYAGLQKIRNSFIVCASTVPGTYSFDLMEIS